MSHRQFERACDKKLKTCPHCGARARLVQWRDTLNPNATWVECARSACKIMTTSYYDKEPKKAAEMAIRAWNRRPVTRQAGK